MNNPGVWILGATEDPIRTAGLGVVVEYANQHRQPQWIKPSTLRWDYTLFGAPESAQPANTPDHTFDMVFEKIPGGAGKFNTWLVNGKPYPHENEFVLQQGARYRLIFRNRTDDAHPMHLHRHQLELTEINGTRPPASSRTPSSSPITAAPASTSPPTNPASPSSTATSSSTWTTASKPSSATPKGFSLPDVAAIFSRGLHERQSLNANALLSQIAFDWRSDRVALLFTFTHRPGSKSCAP